MCASDAFLSSGGRKRSTLHAGKIRTGTESSRFGIRAQTRTLEPRVGTAHRLLWWAAHVRRFPVQQALR
jgi:hypothetical protein